MKKLFLLTCLLFSIKEALAQSERDSILTLPVTSLKINLNGARIGVEQRLLKHITVQLEGLYGGSNLVKINPQLRYYPRLAGSELMYFGLGYYYKYRKTTYSDSVSNSSSPGYYMKSFTVEKFIHALTINCGLLHKEEIFRHWVHFEFNVGLGVRFKKSNRTGLSADEKIDFREAFIMRPQAYQNTEGKFALYPELNFMWSIVVPIVK